MLLSSLDEGMRASYSWSVLSWREFDSVWGWCQEGVPLAGRGVLHWKEEGISHWVSQDSLCQMVWEALCSHSQLVLTATVWACSVISILQNMCWKLGCRRIRSLTTATQLLCGHRLWILDFSLLTGWTWIQQFHEFKHGTYFQDPEGAVNMFR